MKKTFCFLQLVHFNGKNSMRICLLICVHTAHIFCIRIHKWTDMSWTFVSISFTHTYCTQTDCDTAFFVCVKQSELYIYMYCGIRAYCFSTLRVLLLCANEERSCSASMVIVVVLMFICNTYSYTYTLTTAAKSSFARNKCVSNGSDEYQFWQIRIVRFIYISATPKEYLNRNECSPVVTI